MAPPPFEVTRPASGPPHEKYGSGIGERQVVNETALRTKRRPFDEIKLLNKHAIRWRFHPKKNRWEIAAYLQGSKTEPLLSVTGEAIQAWTRYGPGSEEFSEALGMVALSTSLKIQSKRINGR